MEDSKHRQHAEIIPLFGRDEMNLAQLAYGPITPVETNTLELPFDVVDPTLKREVRREIIIRGSDKYGLPKPTDDQVLIGMKTLTHEAGYDSRRIQFSGYHLCRTIGWTPNGDSYKRLEESFDRMMGTTLKFKDAWWDKGKKEWRSDSFHLIDNYGLCTRDALDRARLRDGRTSHRLSYFVWNEVIWKSLQDGYIKELDMAMFRKIRKKKRSEVALRLFRILDKRFYKTRIARFDDLRDLCERQVGLGKHYSLSQLIRSVDRAVTWLCECEFLSGVRYGKKRNRTCSVEFAKYRAPKKVNRAQPFSVSVEVEGTDEHKRWLAEQNEEGLLELESQALTAGFGTTLERNLVERDREAEKRVLESGRIRQEFIRKFAASLAA